MFPACAAVFWQSRGWGERNFGEDGHRALLLVGARPTCRCLCELLVDPSTGTAPPGLWSSAGQRANSWFGRVSRCAAHLGRGQGAESLLHCRRALQVSSALVREAERKMVLDVFSFRTFAGGLLVGQSFPLPL